LLAQKEDNINRGALARNEKPKSTTNFKLAFYWGYYDPQ